MPRSPRCRRDASRRLRHRTRGPGSDASKPNSSQPGGGIASSQLSSAVFGGGPIVGVASTSKAKSIREFNHKNHYNDWQFIYDPTMDRSTPDYHTGAAGVASVGSAAAELVGPKFSPGLLELAQQFGGMQSSPPPAQPAPQQQQQ